MIFKVICQRSRSPGQIFRRGDTPRFALPLFLFFLAIVLSVLLRFTDSEYCSRSPEFIPGCLWGSCCSIFSHLGSVLSIKVCFMLLSFFCWSLYCLLFFVLRLLIIIRLYSNFSFLKYKPIIQSNILFLDFSCSLLISALYVFFN